MFRMRRGRFDLVFFCSCCSQNNIRAGGALKMWGPGVQSTQEAAHGTEMMMLRHLLCFLHNTFRTADEAPYCVDMSTAGVCRCLQVSASVCKCLQVSASVCRCLQVSAGVCKCLQVSAGVCKCLQVSAGVCRCLQVSASVCRYLQVSAGVCKCLQVSAGICRYLQVSDICKFCYSINILWKK